jgi:hypothetical protein
MIGQAQQLATCVGVTRACEVLTVSRGVANPQPTDVRKSGSKVRTSSFSWDVFLSDATDADGWVNPTTP